MTRQKLVLRFKLSQSARPTELVHRLCSQYRAGNQEDRTTARVGLVRAAATFAHTQGRAAPPEEGLRSPWRGPEVDSQFEDRDLDK